MRRRLLVLAGAVLVGLTVVGYAVFNTVLLSFQNQAQAAPTPCLATVGPVGDPQGAGGQQQAAQLDDEQRSIAAAIIGIGQQRQLPPRAWQVALQAGMTESRLRNLTHGDRDSLGIFQMRPSMGWGTVAQVTDVDYQVNTFYDVLLELPYWETMRPGDAAQRVERSAYPDRYHEWEAMAVVLLGGVGGVSDPSGCGTGGGAGAPTAAAGQAIEAALSKQGSRYVWGAKGPDEFDCSGLVHWAYQQAGVTVPMGSWMQWDAGQRFPLQQAMPGDLVFWAYDPAEPASIHHVAIYMGNDRVVQAPYTGQPVQVSGLHSDLTSSDELMPMVVRPGT